MLANLNIRIGADISEFKKMAAKMEKTLAPLRDTLNSIGSAMTARVTLPIIAIGAASVKAASDVEEMESKFDVVFGNLAQGVRDWADQHAEAINRSVYDLQGYAATLQDTFVPLGFARDQAAEMSKQMTELAIDLASFNNASEPETVDLLTSAIIGNHEAVRRFGVVMTEATLNQELLRMGILGGTKAATEQEKVMARMNILFASTKDAQGDAARTSDSFANQLRGLQSAIKEAGVEIGKILIPAATSVVEVVKDAAKWFSGLDGVTKGLIVTVAGLAAALGPLLIALGGIVAIMPYIAAGMTIITGPIGIAVAAVAALAAGALLIYKNWDGVKEFFRKLASSVVVIVTTMADKVLAGMEAALSWVPGLGTAIAKARAYLTDLRAEWAKPMVAGPVVGPTREDMPEIKDDPGPRETPIDTDALERAERIRKILSELPATLRAASNEARIFGTPLDEAEARASAIKSAIVNLLDEGLSPADARVRSLVDQFNLATTAAQRMATESGLADLMAGAGEDLARARAEASALGEEMELPRREAEILEGLIKRLASGTAEWGDTSGLVAAYRVELERATAAVGMLDQQLRIQESRDAFGQSMTLAAANLQLFGDQAAYAQSRVAAIQTQIQTLLEQGIDPMSEEIQSLFADLQISEDLARITSEVSAFSNQMQQIGQEAFTSIGEAIGASIAGTQSLGRGLQQAIGNTAANALSALGTMAIKVGVAAIGVGKTIGAIQKALISLNPAIAIGAGLALVALGATLKGALAGASRSGGGGGGASAGSSGGFGETSITENANVDRTRATGAASASVQEQAPTVNVIMEQRVTAAGDLAYTFTQGSRKLERQGTDAN